jgi:hypothetical protein
VLHSPVQLHHNKKIVRLRRCQVAEISVAEDTIIAIDGVISN